MLIAAPLTPLSLHADRARTSIFALSFSMMRFLETRSPYSRSAVSIMPTTFLLMPRSSSACAFSRAASAALASLTSRASKS